MSTVFRSAPRGRRVSIQAFEVANTIARASNLIKSLSKQRIRHLKEGMLRSEGVLCLISADYSLLSILIEDDIREELRGFCKEVARFGDLCEGPQWHNNLSRFFCRCGSALPYKNNSSEEAPRSMQYLIKLAQNTWVLRQEMLALDRLEHARYVVATPVKKQIDAIKSQTCAVKVLKRKSLWSKSMEDIVEKLVEILGFIHHEINNAFLENHAEQSSGELRVAKNLAKTLGPAGLTLHYANVILQLKTLALASPTIPQNAREALYQALPPRIKPVLHTQLRRRFPLGEKQTMTVAEVRAEMDRVLRWLVPAAESTRLYLGERAVKGMECVDADEENWFEQDSHISVGSILAHADAKVSKVETLYYADKETTEGYIAELVLALHLLVSPTD